MRIAHGQGISQEEASELARMELPTEPSELLAIVGSSPILVGDLLPKVDRRIAALATVDISEIPELELKVVRLKLLRGLLTETIQTKMLGLAFVLDKVGTSASDKRDEAQQKIESQARRSFSENEIPRMMKQSEVDTILDLDTKLREQGTSLKVLEDEYKDRMLRTVFVQQLIPKEPEVTLSEIHRYYTLHPAEFTVAAGARWEQLTVLFENFPSRTAALEAITAMGREAYFGGNVQSVAREKSQEPMASKGGLHNWTSQGSLRSKLLENEIFTLPLNRLSNIIEDENGFHIIRVLERRESSVKPLSEVQDEIRETIAATKLKAAEAEVLEKIRRDIPVWSRYPDDVQGAKPLEGATTISIRG
jgi:parvulin-like peptidyl-prolyl isomerase